MNRNQVTEFMQRNRAQMTISELVTRANVEMKNAFYFYNAPDRKSHMAVGDLWARHAVASFEAIAAQ